MRVLTVVRDCHVDLAKVDPCNFPTYRCTLRFVYEVGRDRFVLCSRPVNDHRLRLVPFPGDNEWIVPLAIGEPEFSILQLNSLALILNPEVPATPTRRVSM